VLLVGTALRRLRAASGALAATRRFVVAGGERAYVARETQHVCSGSASIDRRADSNGLTAEGSLRLLGPVTRKRIPGGVVHALPLDLREALVASSMALTAWVDITPLARNEFICWVEDAKQATTRARRIRRTQEELEEGQRRPCCWPGCKHRERTGR
jgi:hypothetical protein